MTSVIIATLVSILPTLAIHKISKSIDPAHIAIYLSLISAATAYAYWTDKEKAKSDAWRIPERTLHLLELAGGWVAAFFSQRVFRHKISKRSYQIGFWAIAIVHQYASFDFLNEWRFTQAAFQSIEQILK